MSHYSSELRVSMSVFQRLSSNPCAACPLLRLYIPTRGSEAQSWYFIAAAVFLPQSHPWIRFTKRVVSSPFPQACIQQRSRPPSLRYCSQSALSLIYISKSSFSFNSHSSRVFLLPTALATNHANTTITGGRRRLDRFTLRQPSNLIEECVAPRPRIAQHARD